MRTKRILAFLGLALIVWAATACVMFFWNAHQRKEAARLVAAKTVVATVNGEPIYESELSAGLPGDSFDMTISNIKRSKLNRIAGIHLVSQLLKSNGIKVTADEIDAQVKDLQKNPPRSSCPCCRYGSLAEYLAANYMDMQELRESIANNIGFNRYLAAQWEKDFPPGEKRDSVVQREKSRISRQYLKASHIMFRTFQQSAFPDPMDRKKAQEKALAALEQLGKGEAFEVLAKEASEDVFTKSLGGELGCIPVDYFGKQFARAVTALAPGERTTKLVDSPWGFHIVRREAITDKDVAGVVASEYSDRKSQETLDTLNKSAVIKMMTDKSSAQDTGT